MLNLESVGSMDDIVVLAPTHRWPRKAVKSLNVVLTSLNLEKHPENTFIGRIEKGFEFLGYRFSPDGLRAARNTVENFVARAIRLYEREPGGPFRSSALDSTCNAQSIDLSAGVRSCQNGVSETFCMTQIVRKTRRLARGAWELKPLMEGTLSSWLAVERGKLKQPRA